MTVSIVPDGPNKGATFRSLVLDVPTRRRLAAGASPVMPSGSQMRGFAQSLVDMLKPGSGLKVPELGDDWWGDLQKFLGIVEGLYGDDAGSVATDPAKPLTGSDMPALLGGRRPKPGTRVRTLNKAQQREAKRQADLRFEKRLRAHGITPGWTPAQRLANQKK